MYEKPEISDSELERFMDFDQVLIKRKTLIKKRKMYYAVSGTTAVVLVALFSWWMFSATNNLQIQQKREIATGHAEPKISEVIAVDSAERSSTEMKPERKLSPPPKKEARGHQPTKIITEAVEPVYIQSMPVKGYANLYAYFERELTYPEAAISDSVQGTVTVHCNIAKDGKLKDIQIENSLGDLFDKEVLRIIENMPAWNPATLNQNPIESKISFPLSFKLKTTRHD